MLLLYMHFVRSRRLWMLRNQGRLSYLSSETYLLLFRFTNSDFVGRQRFAWSWLLLSISIGIIPSLFFRRRAGDSRFMSTKPLLATRSFLQSELVTDFFLCGRKIIMEASRTISLFFSRRSWVCSYLNRRSVGYICNVSHRCFGSLLNFGAIGMRS